MSHCDADQTDVLFQLEAQLSQSVAQTLAAL
jgi:hypothetical protein